MKGNHEKHSGLCAPRLLTGMILLLTLAWYAPAARGMETPEPAPDCSLSAGDRPDPDRPAGANDTEIPIEHIIVIMQENHSFDNYLGKLNLPQFYGSAIDGVTDSMSNPDANGNSVPVYPETSLCPDDPDHTWNGEHKSWNQAALDGFVRTNGKSVMGYYDDRAIPIYYALADQFATADRYFCSVLSQTFPNRFFLMTGTAFGEIKNNLPIAPWDYHQKTIFDVLNHAHVSWAYYTDAPLGGYPHLFRPMWRRNFFRMKSLTAFRHALRDGKLPHVVFLDSSFEGEDEHPEANIQVGQDWVGKRVQELMGSTAWANSVLFLTYDENGGFFDHVPPPRACLPDGKSPKLKKGDLPGTYDRYGFRVPFIAISPFVKHHYVSHRTYDHTSILRFIETKFNLPALTARDANADPMLDLFDFAHPDYTLPRLPPPSASPHTSCDLASSGG